MKKYDIFLFDADNTLYDFNKASAHALKTLFNEFGFDYSGHIPKRLMDISTPLWKSYEKGEISDNDLQRLRFVRLFDELGVQHDPVIFNDMYLQTLGKNPFLITGALDVCRKIVNYSKQLFIVTNGFLASQESRQRHSPIRGYISDAFISETVGHKKPSREYFEHVFSHIPQVDKKKILIVGDSLTADIAGGNAAGIDSCWFNMHSHVNHTAIEPTYEISKLSELDKFI